MKIKDLLPALAQLGLDHGYETEVYLHSAAGEKTPNIFVVKMLVENSATGEQEVVLRNWP